jgi:iron complex outermembrane receptor protein
MKKIALLCATTAFVLPGMAMAQSTGTIATEEDTTVVVTGNRTRDVNGITVPDTAKAQGVLGQELIQTQAPGQSILQTVNLVPGVNFTNSDPYGSSGGNLRIRGFDGNRVSLTFDGIPLNDSGNYAIFSNQQMDPELIEQVNVNLGQTDVDSPTASAAGGTVNYRTILPSRDLMIRVNGSIGDFDYRRGHIQIHSGEWWENGPRAFVAYSNARNDLFRGPGEIYKQQFNARIYWPLGANGDFVSISGHYNRNRNNFYRNPSFNDLRNTPLPTGAGILGTAVVAPADPDNPSLIGADYTQAQWDAIFNFNNFATCTRASEPGGPGAQNDNGGQLPSGATTPASNVAAGGANNVLNTSSCSNFAGVRINPSNTGNIRINGRFTLADNLILTVDPSFQYVLANGGGSTAILENNIRVRGATPASPGVDYNGDGDFLDTIRFYTPNNTNTHRYGITASLIWDVAENHRLRFAYTFDRAEHRQTGEWGFLDANGNPESPFSGRNATPVLDATGFQFQQRDRKSIAMLNQVAGQYIGRFFEERLRVEIGLRVPFFKRELDQRCLTEARGSGFAYCTSETAPPLLIIAPDAVVPSAGPTPYYAPFRTTYKFDAVLPNIGLVYNLGGGFSVFGSYAMGFSAPRTDNLYRAPRVDNLEPEKTDAFDLGVRYSRSNVQAQATAWMINYSNRIVSSFNPDLGISLDRNVGKVDSWGVDASIAWQPIPELSLYALGSYISAELQENVQIGGNSATVCNPLPTPPQTVCAPTAGRMVPETPEWTFGGRAQANLGPFTFGAQVKWVDTRFATDTNDILVDDYTVFDADVRFDLGSIGLRDSYIQFNVTNLFNERYFGNISTQLNAAGNPNFSVGSPQTFMLTLNLAWRAGN